MRILVVGAGATGGYFGGRLLQAGRDVTFLVRPKRAELLAKNGLVIKSPHGDMTLGNPPTVQATGLRQTFDLVLLSCKAFDLEEAITSFARAAEPRTAILPLLNGMRHLETLDATFGRERVLGGLCSLAVTLNEKREVVHLAPMQSLRFGERDGGTSERVRGDRRSFRRRQLRSTGVRNHHSGHVGKMGVSGDARRRDLRDARIHRPDRRCAWRTRFHPCRT